MHKCIICGKDTENETIIGDATIHLCNRRKCQGIFSFRVMGSFPIVWLCPKDVLEDEYISEEVLEYFEKNPDKFVGIAQFNGDNMWENNFGDIFHDVTRDAGDNMEEDYINNIPFNQLPIIINHLKTERAKELYKKRFEKGE